MSLQNKSFRSIFMITTMITVCAWTLAFVFAAIAGETPNDALKKVESRVNPSQLHVEHREVAGLEGIDKVRVASVSDIEVRYGDTKEAVVEYSGRASQNDPVEVTRNGNELKIELEKRDRSWSVNLAIDTDDEKSKGYGMRVTLPKSFDKSVEVSTPSGDIKLNGLKVSELVARVASGEIESEGTTAKSGVFKATSGSLKINKFVGPLEVSITSGEIDINDFKGESLNVRATSGDIDVSVIDTREVEARVTSGDIKVKLADPKGWKFKLNVTSGDIDNAFKDDPNGTKTMRLSATSGDIQVVR